MAKPDALDRARADALRAPDQPVAVCRQSERTWVEIVLKTEEGKPVPFEEFLVIASDGSEHPGSLDGKGFARVEDLPPGDCQITFPRRHAREWK